MGQKSIQFFPEQASSIAGHVDGLYLYMVLVSAFFSILIGVLIVVFAVKYRRRSEAEVPKPIHGGLLLEITWSVIPLGLSASHVRVGGQYLFHRISPARGLHGDLRHRQTVDVEDPAYGRTT